MKNLLNRLINHDTLSTEEAKQILVNISNDVYNPSQIACFLSVFMMRSITLEELKGFRDALLELCLPVNLSDFNAIDIVGTGGDGKNTFNISTYRLLLRLAQVFMFLNMEIMAYHLHRVLQMLWSI